VNSLDNLPTTDRYGFPVEVCGRCGGTGQHSYNQLHGSVCYGCDGKKVRHTRKARPLFQEWAHALKRQREALGRDLKAGDELAIVEALDAFRVRILGWHTVTQLILTDKVMGSSGTWDREAKGWTYTPSSWELVIHFDDGEVFKACTHTIFRRKGWIDPAPYVAKAQVRPRRKAGAAQSGA
jgi:hypothetical protein